MKVVEKKSVFGDGSQMVKLEYFSESRIIRLIRKEVIETEEKDILLIFMEEYGIDKSSNNLIKVNDIKIWGGCWIWDKLEEGKIYEIKWNGKKKDKKLKRMINSFDLSEIVVD